MDCPNPVFPTPGIIELPTTAPGRALLVDVFLAGLGELVDSLSVRKLVGAQECVLARGPTL